jgi:hypothetical protein
MSYGRGRRIGVAGTWGERGGKPSSKYIYITPAGETTLVLVGGPLLSDDGEKFLARTSALSKAVVMFWSGGGSVVAGIEIGEAIRKKRLYHSCHVPLRLRMRPRVAWRSATVHDH